MTQAALADQVGCSINTINAIERGRAYPSWELAAKLANFFEIDPRELFPVADPALPVGEGAHA